MQPTAASFTPGLPGGGDEIADANAEHRVIDPGEQRVLRTVNASTIPALEMLPDAVVPQGCDEFTHRQVVDLYVAHHASLVRLAALVAPEDGMAEDLVQEAFVRLYRSWRRVREPEKVPAYLRATVVNLARGRARRMSVALRHRSAPDPDAGSAEDGALRHESERQVVELLRQLPTRQRECLVLRYYQNLTEREIAEVLQISVGSVRTHTSRGMAALERQLGVPS